MVALLLAFGIFSAQASERVLNPFRFDGCTMFPEGTRVEPKLWAECCLEHDVRFWVGGAKKLRLKADQRLRECVIEKGKPEIAALMYKGVRLGSHSPIKRTPGHWGNSRFAKRDYAPLREKDILRVQQELPLYNIPIDIQIRVLDSLGN